MSEIVKVVHKALIEGNVPVKNFRTIYSIPDKDENDPELYDVQDGKITEMDWSEATVVPDSIDKINDELKLEIKEKMKIKGAECYVGRGYLMINPFKKKYCVAEPYDDSGKMSKRNLKKVSKVMERVGFKKGINLNFF